MNKKSKIIIALIVTTVLSAGLGFKVSSAYEFGFFGGKNEITFTTFEQFEEFYTLTAEDQLDYLGTEIHGLNNIFYSDFSDYMRLFKNAKDNKITEGTAILPYVGYDVNKVEYTKDVIINYQVEGTSIIEEKPGFFGGEDEITFTNISDFQDFYKLTAKGQLEALGVEIVDLNNIFYDDFSDYMTLYANAKNGEITTGNANLTYVGYDKDNNEYTKDLTIYYDNETEVVIPDGDVGFFGGVNEYEFNSAQELKDFDISMTVEEQLDLLGIKAQGMTSVKEDKTQTHEFSNQAADVMMGNSNYVNASFTFCGSLNNGEHIYRTVRLIYNGN
ncbi:MAG: hypothetical protein ACK5HR_04945 [Mycoplasmatales bacterium]